MGVPSHRLAVSVLVLGCAQVALAQTADEVIARIRDGDRRTRCPRETENPLDDGDDYAVKVEHNVAIDDALFSKPTTP